MMAGEKEILIYPADRMQRIKEVIDQIANTDVTILIQGKSGVGKEVVNKLGKVFPSLMISVAEKVLQPSISPQTYKKGVTAMKKMNAIIHYFVVVMLIATFVACASTPKQESTGEYVDDSVLTTKVKSLLAEDAFLKSFDISVKSFKGIVELSGFVDSQKTIDKATEIASSVKGVKSVKNNLIVK